MAIMADLYAQIFVEPEPTPEEVRAHLDEEKEREDYFWQVECEAWPIDLKEKEELVKEKCARLAQKLRAAKSDQLKAGTQVIEVGSGSKQGPQD